MVVFDQRRGMLAALLFLRAHREVTMLATEYRECLDDILRDAERFGPSDAALLRRIELSTERLLLTRAREAEAGATRDELKELRRESQALLRPVWERGLLGHEVSHWPSGAGSARSMELIYENRPLEHALDVHYSEWFLLTRDLAHAVRSRRDVLRDLLLRELGSRARALRVVDLGCGPCQSLREALSDIPEPRRLRVRAIDTDAVTQRVNTEYFCETRGMPWRFETANALRVDLGSGVNDVVYSTGLYDYLTSHTLVTLWRSVYASLAPGGVAFLAVKDGARFCPLFYRWAVPWDQFHVRTTRTFVEIIREAGMPEPEAVCRDATGCVVFYSVRRAA
jgi:SAM-dependent methyltransferase